MEIQEKYTRRGSQSRAEGLGGEGFQAGRLESALGLLGSLSPTKPEEIFQATRNVIARLIYTRHCLIAQIFH